MAATTGRTHSDVSSPVTNRPSLARRLSTETKSAFKTTEFYVYIIASAAVLIAATVVDEKNGGGFGAKQAWLYFTLLSIGYIVSRGIAKAGSRDPYWSEDDDR